MTQTSGSFFDLSILSKVNEGKDNEREELKLVGHGLPFEECIKQIVSFKMKELIIPEKQYSVKEYISLYSKTIDEISKLFID